MYSCKYFLGLSTPSTYYYVGMLKVSTVGTLLIIFFRAPITVNPLLPAPAARVFKLGRSFPPARDEHPAQPGPEPGTRPFPSLPSPFLVLLTVLELQPCGPTPPARPVCFQQQQQPPHFSPLRFVGCLKLSNGVNQWSVHC